MAGFRTLSLLGRKSNPRSRLLFHAFAASSWPPAPPSPLPPPSVRQLSILTPSPPGQPNPSSPLRGWIPLSGPLFLSTTPWKLLQSATPLYLRGREAIFAKDLLLARSFPVQLGFRSPRVNGAVLWGRSGSREDEASPAAGAVEHERLLNLPNIISISRMVSGPLIGWMIINEWYLPAFCALAVSGATDWLDGFVARKININSVFGSYLDPLADKVLIGCVAISMVEKDLLHPGLVAIVICRDIVLVAGAVYKRAANLGWEWKSWYDFVNLDAVHSEKMEPLFISKVNTVFQLLLVSAALLQPELGNEETQLYVTYLSWLVVSTTVASLAAYVSRYFRRRVFLTP